jgi:signal transduction histidine kinase
MSHELRTPLNAIIGYSEILIEETAADDQQFTDLQAINGAGQKLLRLINELLDLSKLEAGKMNLHLEAFALDGFVDEIARQWLKPIAEGGNEFRVERAADLGEVVGDTAKLRQAVTSLLSNAAKHTKDGRITLAVSNQGGQIRIAVRDTGSGISPDRMVNLFETFGKHEGETSSIYREDPGLGLPLSQRLCLLMGGDLSADSELGRGSCFTIRIPSHGAQHKASNAAESAVLALA